MANPAPTINQINAFNATQGTTIDFNIIGGTELVRSNRIYIYDLSDNSLICTHLYVSTESIHELPPNTDGSIVYESGKSSADFVNGAQYYAQIQTFTDIAGTEGGSGLSVAKMFWCLVDPTLTITTIPSTISTTSYNVSATYTDTSASVVSNIIQQYQFNLYSAVGSLLQSSGVVVGSGTQQGTSTTYDISYNFTGLNVGSSYYVTVDVTTTQGMSVTTQSNTFTVSIDTPTLGEATVVNNACDGYISVTSNLSSEYGGSGSGDIVSFETDSENVFTKLQVDIDPVQDLNGYDAPWVGGAGKNKLPNLGTAKTENGITFTPQSDGSVLVNGTATGTATYRMVTDSDAFTLPSGTYIISGEKNSSQSIGWSIGGTISYSTTGSGAQISLESETTFDFVFIRIASGQTLSNIRFYPMIRLASVTDATYAPYENICPISGRASVDVAVTGANIIDTNTNESGAIDESGNLTVNATFNRTQYISVTSSGTIVVKTSAGSGYVIRVHGYNSSGTWVQQLDAIITTGEEVLLDIPVPSTVSQVRISYPLVGLNNTYLYNGQSYTTQLGQTVYGGTLDLVSGVLTVDRKAVFYDGSSDETWGMETQANDKSFYIARQSDAKAFTDVDISNMMYSTFPFTKNGWVVGSCRLTSGYYNFVVGSVVGATTVDQWRTWLNSNPISYTYELATPQTYQLTPQQVETLVGVNNAWSEQGDVELSYHIPITNLLVKRQDVDDVSGDWLTLYSQPITQASDMDFTFIDFTNQYGKTYKYALVPLLTQTQSGVEVEVEGGYTVSDEVQSVFDGVFIADATGSQKCKANVGYGNVDMNQSVGSITPIGSQYPIIVTNSNNRYHNGSISGMIVPDDYYYNGNLSRIDMVNKRNELEQFLTNKRAKIIKDWNSNIWLVMIMDNIDCSFDNNYGMGMVTFNANWLEVGDPTNQEDLQATGLVNVGGV